MDSRVSNHRASRHCGTCSCDSGGVIRWRPVVAVLLLMACWDTVALLTGATSFTLRPGHDVLRDAVALRSIVGGLVLLAISATAAGALMAQRHRGGRVSHVLRLGLSCLAAYWVTWCFGVCLAFVAYGESHAWGAVGRLVGTAAIAVLAARVPPPTAAHRTGKVNRAVGRARLAATGGSRSEQVRAAAGG